MRTGREYLQSLDDARAVYLDGERVADIPGHPAFAGIARTVAGLYDYSADPANGLQTSVPKVSGAVNTAFIIPRSQEDLRRRREAITKWAKLTNGLVGRGPDHVAGFLAGFAGSPDTFARADARFGQNVQRFYRRVLQEDLYVSYVIVPPQVDRSKTAGSWDDRFLQVGVFEERDDGIVVRGAQMLGTGAAVSNWLFVSCIHPLRPGDEDYANSFVIPIDAPGLRLYCRPPYALGKSSVFDYPLSTRFDESDALAVFDDVFVPWEQVFVVRNVELTREQFHGTPAHVLGNTQAQIRLVVKLKFLLGIARKIAAMNRSDVIPAVQETLGELAAVAAHVEGMVLAAEAACLTDRNGVAKPNPRFLYGAMALQAETYPRAIQTLRTLAGGGVLQMPSSYRDLVDPETAPDIERYVRSGDETAEERIKLFRLAWDLVGSEFGGRHQQYEMFYAGAPFVAKGYSYRNYGLDEAVELVDRFMATYDLERARAGS